MSFIYRKTSEGQVQSPEELLREQILVQRKYHPKLPVEIFG